MLVILSPSLLAPVRGFAYLVRMTMKTSHVRESASASKTFIRNLVWVMVICVLFLAGQLLRYYFENTQLSEIISETEKLYVSVLGDDIGGSPFGRLQFEQGKLAAITRIGLDPASVLAALSKPAVESLRLEELSLKGQRGHAKGFFGPNVEQFDEYISALAEDEQFIFTLGKKENVFGGIAFSLIVEPQ